MAMAASFTDGIRIQNHRCAEDIWESSIIRKWGAQEAIPLRRDKASTMDKYRLMRAQTVGGWAYKVIHHSTTLVLFRPDGIVELNPFDSASTRHVFDECTPFRVSTYNGVQYLGGWSARPDTLVTPQPPLSGAKVRLKWVDGRWVILNPDEAVSAPVGPGRASLTPEVGRFIRAADHHRRALATYANVDSSDLIPGIRAAVDMAEVDRWAYTGYRRQLRQLIESLGWTPGDPVPSYIGAISHTTWERIKSDIRREVKARQCEDGNWRLTGARSVDCIDYNEALKQASSGNLLDPDGFLQSELWAEWPL